MAIDGNSTKNQKIKGKFVAREVFHCQSCLISGILEQGKPLSIEDIENLYYYVCPECGEALEPMDESGYMQCGSCGISYVEEDPIEQEPAEIFEWWLVSEYLYKELKKRGLPVLTDGQCYWWGRCTTGQAILLDWIITEICADMEILEGQAHDWSKY